jgi:hypothetical protein
MTKVRAAFPWESGLGQKAFFITLGGPKAHDSSGRDDNSVGSWIYPHALKNRDLDKLVFSGYFAL